MSPHQKTYDLEMLGFCHHGASGLLVKLQLLGIHFFMTSVRHKPTRRASGNEVLLKQMVGHQTGDHQNPIKCKWCWRVPEFPLLLRKSNKKNMLIMGKMFMNFTPIFFTTKCSPINPIPTIMSTKGTVHPLLQPPVHHHRFVPHDLHSEWSRHHHLHLDFSTRNACYLNSNGPPRLVGVFRVFLWWFV